MALRRPRPLPTAPLPLSPLPVGCRGQAVAVATITNFSSNFLVSLALPSIQETWGQAGGAGVACQRVGVGRASGWEKAGRDGSTCGGSCGSSALEVGLCWAEASGIGPCTPPRIRTSALTCRLSPLTSNPPLLAPHPTPLLQPPTLRLPPLAWVLSLLSTP